MIFNPNLAAGTKMVTGTINISYVGNNGVYPDFLYVDDSGWHNIDRGQVTISTPENSLLVFYQREPGFIGPQASTSGGITKVFSQKWNSIEVMVFFVTSDFTLSIS
jgi:hypothetical protein